MVLFCPSPWCGRRTTVPNSRQGDIPTLNPLTCEWGNCPLVDTLPTGFHFLCEAPSGGRRRQAGRWETLVLSMDGLKGDLVGQVGSWSPILLNISRVDWIQLCGDTIFWSKDIMFRTMIQPSWHIKIETKFSVRQEATNVWQPPHPASAPTLIQSF